MSTPKIGLLFSVFDGDQKHFARFGEELKRLKFPFAVNFDHCCKETKDYFKGLLNFLDGYENDATASTDDYFDESHRQKALEILLREKFDWALQMDVDETLEALAISKIYHATTLGADIVDFPVLDLWGDGKTYRVDGPFASSHREKMFNLKVDPAIKYSHPTVHAPKIHPPGREVIVTKFNCRILHWGIMNDDDCKEHTERWNTIYTRKVGNNPYASGFYSWINDPTKVPILRPVPQDVFIGE